MSYLSIKNSEKLLFYVETTVEPYNSTDVLRVLII